MKRYNLYDMKYGKDLRASFDAIEESNGEWVRWEDVKQLVFLVEFMREFTKDFEEEAEK